MNNNALYWIGYALIVLVVSGVAGRHLRRFGKAYTEMTGMMAGMTMGMLNGFMAGYCVAAASTSMFWGNLVGITVGLAFGAYFGSAGDLMGIMDGSMGGAMGGSMGAMLAAMLFFPLWAMNVTGVLLVPLYVAGMIGLVALIEKSAPEQAEFHRMLPFLRRATGGQRQSLEAVQKPASTASGPAVLLTDYYTLLGLPQTAGAGEIGDAYLNKLVQVEAESKEADLVERAYATLTDPAKRKVYDTHLAESQASAPGACCPPRRKKAANTGDAADVGTASAPAAAVLPASKAAAPSRAAATSAPAGPAAPSAASQRTANAPAAARAQANGTSGQAGAPQRSKQGQPVRRGEAGQPRRANSRPIRARANTRGYGDQREAPISWVGVTVAIVTLAIVGAWWLGSHSGPAAFGGASSASAAGISQPAASYSRNTANLSDQQLQKLEAIATTPAVGADGKETVDFAVSGDDRGYTPRVLKVKKGVPVHLNVSVEGRDPGCGRLITFRGLGAQVVAYPGQTVPLDFTPTTSGVYEINCGMGMMQPGYVIVTES